MGTKEKGPAQDAGKSEAEKLRSEEAEKKKIRREEAKLSKIKLLQSLKIL